jgi:hypothetical protein
VTTKKSSLGFSPIRWLCAATLTLALPLVSTARDYVPVEVGALVEYYEIDLKNLPALLRDYQEENTATSLLNKIQGDARLVESTYLVTHIGQRAKIESCQERLFPIAYNRAYKLNTQTIIPARPTDVEQRNVGCLLEFAADLTSDSEVVALTIAPERVEFHGFKTMGENETSTVSPEFHAMKTSTSLDMKFGTSALLGIFIPARSDKKRVLGFITPFKFHIFQDQQNEIDSRNIFAPSTEGGEASMISTFTEYIEVDAVLASQLIRQQTRTVDASIIRAQLDELISKGSAKVLHIDSLLTRGGQRAKSESIRELRFPAEDEPPSAVMKLPDSKTGQPIGSAIFDTRSTGFTVQMEPLASADQETIELYISPTHVRHTGNETYGDGRYAIQQPVFETLSLSTKITAINGKPMLIGMHSLETARAAKMASDEERSAMQNRRILVFVTSKVKVHTTTPTK